MITHLNNDELLQRLSVLAEESADGGLDLIESGSGANRGCADIMRALKRKMTLGDERSNEKLLQEFVELSVRVAETKRKAPKTKSEYFRKKGQILSRIPKGNHEGCVASAVTD